MHGGAKLADNICHGNVISQNFREFYNAMINQHFREFYTSVTSVDFQCPTNAAGIRFQSLIVKHENFEHVPSMHLMHQHTHCSM
jgi:hypothetical protein